MKDFFFFFFAWPYPIQSFQQTVAIVDPSTLIHTGRSTFKNWIASFVILVAILVAIVDPSTLIHNCP